MIAKWLRRNPTTEQTPFKLPVQGLPTMKVVPPAAPRGWKMGTILPLHSPAVTGGGVSENMFKDMMAELQGGEGGVPGLPGAAEGSGGEKKSKKDKKKNKA
jgi:signal recognition particle subunit SRP19